jgi:hypothetical protein
MRAAVSAVCFFLFFNAASYAEDALWGFELNFGNASTLYSTKEENYIQAYTKKWSTAILAGCPECKVTSMDDKYGGERPKYRVTYPDGYWIEIFQDPGVVEVTGKRASRAEIERNRVRLQKDIFDRAALLDLKPMAIGHLNLDYQTGLRGNLKLMSTFIADMSEHPELASGILYHDFSNARPMAALPESYQRKFIELHSEVRAGRLTSPREYAKFLEREVYLVGGWDPPSKYQAYNVNSFVASDNPDDWRVEVRGAKAQGSVDELLLGMEFYESRLHYLEKLDAPIQYGIQSIPAGGFSLAEMSGRFERLTAEIGKSPEHFALILLPTMKERVLSDAAKCSPKFSKVAGGEPLLRRP